MTLSSPRALIAEDEPLLANALRLELAQAWPALQIVATVGDGLSAVREALACLPDVLFFDIRMPGQSGLQAAAALAQAWPPHHPFPALVFTTAYDQYAVEAFEAQALDYLLKPVQRARLQKTVHKLQQRLEPQAPASAAFHAAFTQWHAWLAQSEGARPRMAHAPAPLTVIQAAHGSAIHMVPVTEVLYFEAADKYVRVLTCQQEYLIRTPIKDLMAQLDGHTFWQVHRGTLVRANAIVRVLRDAAGRLRVQLQGRSETLPVSRLYAHRFRAM